MLLDASPASPSCGALRGFGVAFGAQVVLSDVNLTLPALGVLLLLGSAGEGKSTLLRTMAGLNDAQPSLRTWGEMSFVGERPTLVRQNARLLLSSLHENLASGLPTRSSLTRVQQAELLAQHLEHLGLPDLVEELAGDVSSLPRAQQRMAFLARALLGNPACLLLDEPSAGLLDDEAGAQRILDLVLLESERRLVVVTTHNQRHARRLGGEVVLLADGTVHERTLTKDFFGASASPAAQMFVRSGRCSLAPRGPQAPEEHEGAEAGVESETPVAPLATSRMVGPQGFYWLFQGQLGGSPRPGVTTEERWDVAAIARLGTTILVSLEERLFHDAEALAEHGMRSLELRIADMDAPGVAAAGAFCQRVEQQLAAGEVIVLHCRAGLGRTGTMLAAQLIWRGTLAAEALERVRAINPKWVQSDRQIAFLSEFHAWCGDGMRPSPAALHEENVT